MHGPDLKTGTADIRCASKFVSNITLLLLVAYQVPTVVWYLRLLDHADVLGISKIRIAQNHQGETKSCC